MRIWAIVICFSALNFLFAQSYEIVEQTPNSITVKYFPDNYSYQYVENDSLKGYVISHNKPWVNIGQPNLPLENVQIAVPHYSNPVLKILSSKTETLTNRFILPYYEYLDDVYLKSISKFDENVYGSNLLFPKEQLFLTSPITVRFNRIQNVSIAPIQFNPVQRNLIQLKEVVFKIEFNTTETNFERVNKNDRLNKTIISGTVINTEQAELFSSLIKNRQAQKLNSSWYQPGQKYFKIEIAEKGVYRISYNELKSIYSQLEPVSKELLAIFNFGEIIPIDVLDNNSDGLFGPDDYIQFIGYPPPPSKYATLNLFNDHNIYWLAIEHTGDNFFYIDKDGQSNIFEKTVDTSIETIHFEKDTLYERLGYAPDGERDYWFWGTSSGSEGNFNKVFIHEFILPQNLDEGEDLVTISGLLHGMTTGEHNVEIRISSQPIGQLSWWGQDTATFSFTFSRDDVSLYPTNTFEVFVPGNLSNNRSDEIRINWFNMSYTKNHIANGESISFQSENTDEPIRFVFYRWKGNDVKIYIPNSGEVIRNAVITNDFYESVYFIDTADEYKEYFCVSSNHYNEPNSIIFYYDETDLRNFPGGADYIIISHPNFMEAANRLAQFRSNNLEGYSSPRVAVVDIFDIYNQFTFGMINPVAVRNFISYTFENWNGDSPAYVALLGDMSWDYRGLIEGSRPNFIPSIDYHSYLYGNAVSDNMFAAVAGDDVVPDLAIGRISCETLEEANILVDKIINYPNDNSKEWKQNVFMIGAGENFDDEARFGFNDKSLSINNVYIKPEGYTTDFVFNYPNKPEHEPFLGSTPEIREMFNKGAVISNFYGHGGGYQWDQVFLTDDIYLLQNGNRMPFISSITCYTAHYDNQNVFGEQFNKIPDKGSIGFWGHTGLTFFTHGVTLNNKLFKQIFTNKNHVIGDAIFYAKNEYSGSLSKLTEDHISLLSFLGDPALKLALPEKPDFSIKPDYISISPVAPTVDDSIYVTVKIRNLGSNFSRDSVTIELFELTAQSLIGSKKIAGFGEIDSVKFLWLTENAGLFNLEARINQDGTIDEMDYSDNVAVKSFSVFNLSEPNLLFPINGFVNNNDTLTFTIADIGEYIDKELTYTIEIDTDINFSQPVKNLSNLKAENGIVKAEVTGLPINIYFWRAKIDDDEQLENWSETQTFRVESTSSSTSNFTKDQLKLFKYENMIFENDSKTLVLNTSNLPPKPNEKRFIDSLNIQLPGGLHSLSSITTDGNFIYAAHMAYYGGTSKIYKFNAATGQFIGTLGNYEFSVWHQIAFYDGKIFIPEGNKNYLKYITVTSNDTGSVFIPGGLIESQSAVVRDGSFYISSNGEKIYNLAYKDSLGNLVYTLRIFDPENGWNKVGDDIVFSGQSYQNYQSFFVDGKFVFPYEGNISGYMRRLNIETGLFEEEWITFDPYKGFYSWTYDPINDKVYAAVFKSGFEPKIFKFYGSYNNTSGNVSSPRIGPGVKFNSVTYSLNAEKTESSEYFVHLLGRNSQNKTWEIIDSNYTSASILNFEDGMYDYLQAEFNFVDTSFGAQNRAELISVGFNYIQPVEFVLSKENISTESDSVLQGVYYKLNIKVNNLSSFIDSTEAEVRVLNSDLQSIKEHIKFDSSNESEFEINIPTESLLEASTLDIAIKNGINEKYTYNNSIQKSFYVSPDSTRPNLNVKFDDVEIINGDIVSTNPNIVIEMTDNSPLEIDTTNITIYFDGIRLSFRNDSLIFNQSFQTEQKATINWNPLLDDGIHILEILAKDATGNFHDSTSYRVSFEVNSKDDILNVFNYPNPFTDDTHFTFTLQGRNIPESAKINIYTIAGRKIRTIELNRSDLQFGFNRIYWDGLDQDNDIIANGTYLYKVIVENEGESKSVTKKMAKIK